MLRPRLSFHHSILFSLFCVSLVTARCMWSLFFSSARWRQKRESEWENERSECVRAERQYRHERSYTLDFPDPRWLPQPQWTWQACHLSIRFLICSLYGKPPFFFRSPLSPTLPFFVATFAVVISAFQFSCFFQNWLSSDMENMVLLTSYAKMQNENI